MRIVLTANASYVPPRGGATRSNLAWLETLAARGHECRIVASALAPSATHRQARDEEVDREWRRISSGPGVKCYERADVTVYAVADRVALVPVLREQIRSFRPDWVLVSSEDLGHTLIREAARSASGRMVYLAHTPQFFPFGPASWNPDPAATDIVRRSAAVIAIGRYSGAYVAAHTGREPAIIHPPIYGPGPYPNLGSPESGLMTMINPCAVKGISIFLALADRLRHREFGAMAGWGTTAADAAELFARPNMTALPNCRDIEDFLRRTRVLLMPSLWLEGFGLSVLEAKLRGIPTISSDSGGLMDGNAGTGLVIPVNGIRRFEPVFDEHGMPVPELPPNDIRPWMEALETLLSDAGMYGRLSRDSQAAAVRFVEGIRPERLEEFLLGLTPCGAEPVARSRPESLSPEKRALLLRRLREKGDAARRPS